MKEFSDAKALETEINRVESLQKRVKERESSKSKVPETQEDPEPNWEELVEQGHDPDAIAIQKRTWDKAKQTEALARQVIQAEQARAYEAQCNRFDDVLNSMSDEFGTILGTGRRGELLKASPEQARNRRCLHKDERAEAELNWLASMCHQRHLIQGLSGFLLQTCNKDRSRS
jgi:hypothetical protein